MPSRRSSRLVRDGLVGVKRMEKAFQRQGIYGGSLDTILLEMALVPEDRLPRYLALAAGLPPASRDEGAIDTVDARMPARGRVGSLEARKRLDRWRAIDAVEHRLEPLIAHIAEDVQRRRDPVRGPLLRLPERIVLRNRGTVFPRALRG